MEKFLLIDGSSLAYRAFFALTLLHNKKGEHTNAVFGFARMLLGILSKVNPGYAVAVFDRPGRTFRHEIYDAYKAQREAMPPELSEQMPRIKQLLAAFGFKIIEMDGVEADDLLGTITNQSADYGNEFVENLILTGDTDLFQLISPVTKVLFVRRGITDIQEYDQVRLKEKYGLEPLGMIDYKALKGDPSDNIPGVPGIGEKTALRLLHDYGTLDKILLSAGEMKGKVKDNLELYAQQALLSRELVEIKCNLPLPAYSWCDFRLGKPCYEDIEAIFQEMEFTSLLNELIKIYPAKTVEIDESIPIKCIATTGDMFELTRDFRAGPVAISLDFAPGYPLWDAGLRSFAFVGCAGKAYYIHPQLLLNREWEQLLLNILFPGKQAELYGFDTKLLLNFLESRGAEGVSPVFDACLAAYLLDPGQSTYTPDQLVRDFLKSRLPVMSDRKKNILPDAVEEGRLRAAEAFYLFRLKDVMEEKLRETKLDRLYHEVELPLVKILSAMERRGIRVDHRRLANLSADIKCRLGDLQKNIYEAAGIEFNLNSPRQLAEVLFNRLKLPVKKRTKTGFSTDVKVLEELAADYEIARMIVCHRQLTKLEGTYLTGLMPYIIKETGKIHTTFNQTVTATGRLSSSEPNLQNIPVRLAEGRRIREAFIPSIDGYIFMAADYSQIELRILAHLSRDDTLLEAFRLDEDIHIRTAAEIFDVPFSAVTPEMRKKAKAVNFGIVYGISDYGLAQDIKITRKEAGAYIHNYFKRYQGVKEYMEQTVVQARSTGFVNTLFNRRRFLPEINSDSFNLRSFAERTARNTPIQGAAADIIKIAMREVERCLQEKGLRARLLLQIHDELLLELPEGEREETECVVRSAMESAVSLHVPVKVDIKHGHNWFQL